MAHGRGSRLRGSSQGPPGVLFSNITSEQYAQVTRAHNPLAETAPIPQRRAARHADTFNAMDSTAAPTLGAPKHNRRQYTNAGASAPRARESSRVPQEVKAGSGSKLAYERAKSLRAKALAFGAGLSERSMYDARRGSTGVVIPADMPTQEDLLEGPQRAQTITGAALPPVHGATYVDRWLATRNPADTAARLQRTREAWVEANGGLTEALRRRDIALGRIAPDGAPSASHTNKRRAPHPPTPPAPVHHVSPDHARTSHTLRALSDASGTPVQQEVAWKAFAQNTGGALFPATRAGTIVRTGGDLQTRLRGVDGVSESGAAPSVTASMRSRHLGGGKLVSDRSVRRSQAQQRQLRALSARTNAAEHLSKVPRAVLDASAALQRTP